MGYLQDQTDLNMKVFGGNIVNFYKENTMFMVEKYQGSDEVCEYIPTSKIQVGNFYFLQYKDDSNWMKYSPIFCCDFRKFENMIILLGVNFNFIPLQLRSRIFDKFLTEKDFEKDSSIPASFMGVYSELLKYGFEYAIVEYNVAQIVSVHKINLNLLSRFLYSSHPRNKYDPNKLVQIWTSKLKNREKRHQEIIVSILDEFYDMKEDYSEKYIALEGHISRLQKSLAKFGNK